MDRRGVEVGEQADRCRAANCDQRPAFAVYVGQEARCLALLGEGLERSCCAVHGGVGDGEDGDEHDGIHDRIKTLDPGRLDGDNKRGRLGGNVVGVDESGFCVGDEEADDGDRDNIEDGYAPEYLLDGCGE